MDAIQLLKSDHEKVKDLFDQWEQNENIVNRKSIFDQIRNELEMHTFLEETIFYPSFSQHSDFKDIVRESLEEHQEIKDLLSELTEMEDEMENNEEFDDKMDELFECIEHHVEEEEETFFPRVQEKFSEEHITNLGHQIEEQKVQRGKAA